jgi:hypothetical protein
MFLSPLGERLGEGVNLKTVFCITPSPSLSPKRFKGERSVREEHERAWRARGPARHDGITKHQWRGSRPSAP